MRKILAVAGIFLGLVCVALFCFYHLGYDELNSWDEARHGVSAYEMLQTGDFIVTTWDHSPDYWNLKPPLSEWCIALGYKLFGYNAFGLRFYSALAIFLTALFSALFLLKNYGAVAAVFSLFLLPTFGQLYAYHCTRAADADALFIFFYVSSILCMCNSRRNFRWTYLACLCFSFAFLTKSFHAGLIAFFVLFALLCLGYFKTMRWKQYLICGVCSLLPAGCWAIARYLRDGTAFLIPMFAQDVVNRSSTAIEGHSEAWYYYPATIFKGTNHVLLLFLVLLVFAGLLLCVRSQKGNFSISFFSSDFFLLVVGILIPLIVFSIAKTKLSNYIYCIYPVICLLSGVSLSLLLKGRTKSIQAAILIVSFSLALFVTQKNFRTIIPSADMHDYTLQTVLSLAPIQSGDHVYIAHDFTSYGAGYDWTQAQIMEAEWLTDCFPIYGGAESFANDSDAYLIIANSLLDTVSDYTVLGQTDSYTLLTHNAHK